MLTQFYLHCHMKDKLHFDCDYMQLAHPLILKRLEEMAGHSITGYGRDAVCDEAKHKIREACGCPDAEVQFLVGGTQTNAVMLDVLAAPYEGIVAAHTGHIAVHEAGAIEATGHKVIELPAHDAKLDAAEVDHYLTTFFRDDSWDHMVIPGMVYITHPTEYGTLYSLKELEDIAAVCHRHNLKLYLDGARLGYGLAATGTDVTLKDIARLCDAFYIGGTKVGAMIGEAVVIPNANLVHNLFTQIKRHGALLAKGWLLGVQFDTLFTDNLYFKISRHAILMAEKLKEGLLKKGYKPTIDSPTNQQFLIFTDEQVEKLSKFTTFSIWEKLDGGLNVVRLATAWYTDEKDVDRLLEEM